MLTSMALPEVLDLPGARCAELSRLPDVNPTWTSNFSDASSTLFQQGSESAR